MEPNIHGTTLTVGDELGHDAAPLCCDDQMDREERGRGYIDYSCDGCGCVLTVSPSGLVFDIAN